jgi:hypothetical protein
MEYRHTQFGTVIVGIMGTAVIVVAFHFLASGSVHPAETVVATLLLVTMSLFPSLTVAIQGGALRCSFGVGLIRKEIKLSDIKDVYPVTNPWIVGWGIRWVPGQYWMWNVSGLQAVELTLKTGKRFRIGTDEPDALSRAIQVNKSTAHV